MKPLSFAVIGHPNEGKSSVVSTLTENERVGVSPSPGLTTRCHTHTVRVKGEPVLEIVDTPGFQNPQAVLTWFQAFAGEEKDLVPAFIDAHRAQPDFHHDVELLTPLCERTGILYVADTSRPLRAADRQEMELLRLTGLPRMALINRKRDQEQYEEIWQEALRRQFNLIRPFNAHQASFPERMDLLQALAVLMPEAETRLNRLRTHLMEDWQDRLEQAASILEELLADVTILRVKRPLKPGQAEETARTEAIAEFKRQVNQLEQKARVAWRALYHHEQLPDPGKEADLLSLDPFTARVWRLLGLSRRQLAAAGASAGAALGAGLDVAAGGITFGIFTAGGAVLGGVGAWINSPRLGRKRHPLTGHSTLARESIQVGPCTDPALAYVLLDRGVLYLMRLLNWAHARRDYERFRDGLDSGASWIREWSAADRKCMSRWLKGLQSSTPSAEHHAAVHAILLSRLQSAAQTNKPE
jgi:GTPase Era involved in 16S rRNA processing